MTGEAVMHPHAPVLEGQRRRVEACEEPDAGDFCTDGELRLR